MANIIPIAYVMAALIKLENNISSSIILAITLKAIARPATNAIMQSKISKTELIMKI